MANAQLLQQLHRHASEMPDAQAYRIAGSNHRSITWKELEQAVCHWSQQFAEQLNVGQTLLISAPNSLEMVISILAGFAAGLRVFPLTCEASPQEISRLAGESSAVGAIGTTKLLTALTGKINRSWDIGALAQFGDESVFPARPSGDLILQSSGTTGFPRLVLRGSLSIDAVSRSMVGAIGFTRSDRVLSLLPLSHSYGIEHGLLAPIWAGSTVCLGHGFDMATTTRELNDGVTIFPAVPSIIEMLADLPGAATSLKTLRRIYSAGGPLPLSVYQRFFDRYQLRVSQLYGATEVGSVTFNPPDVANFDPSSVGMPMEGVAIRIVQPAHPGEILPSGSEGHVCIRADSMFAGYLEGSTPLIDGFFPTGDLGQLDGLGRLTITGRLKLLIDVGGLKVNPVEVESVLREHERVSSCVVVPVRQSETVFRVKAIVTPRDAAMPPAIDELRALAKSKLAAYKVPRMFEIRDSLPTTSTGKVLRHLVGEGT